MTRRARAVRNAHVFAMSVAISFAMLLVSSTALAEPAATTTTKDATTTTDAEAASLPSTKYPVLRLDGGFATRSLFDIPIRGGLVEASLGLERRRLGIYGSVGGLFASTENGLGVRAVRPALDAELILDRFRLGAGAGVIFVWVDRALKDSTLDSYGYVIHASARLDVFRPSGLTVFARGTIEYGELLRGMDASFWGPSIGAGVEFDLGTRTRRSDER